jgi:alcohol dehydrogenase (cytochrome c)
MKIRRTSSRQWVAVLFFIVVSFFTVRAVADDLDSLSRDDKQWVMPAKNYANTRFSGLNQINAANAGKLQVAWTFSVGTTHGQEAAPS